MSGLRRFVARWADREPLIVVSVTSIVAVFVVLLLSLATLKENYSIFGPGLGADYPQFYCAGHMIRDGQAENLYDLQLQQDYYHDVLTQEGEESYLPYVYPPFFALPFILLSLLPYHFSFLAWSVALLLLSAAAIMLIFAITESFEKRDRNLVMLARDCVSAFADGSRSLWTDAAGRSICTFTDDVLASSKSPIRVGDCTFTVYLQADNPRADPSTAIDRSAVACDFWIHLRLSDPGIDVNRSRWNDRVH